MAEETSRGRANGAGSERARGAGEAPGSGHNAAEVHGRSWHEPIARARRSPHPLEATQAQRSQTHEASDRQPGSPLEERAQAVLLELLLRGLEENLQRGRRDERRPREEEPRRGRQPAARERSHDEQPDEADGDGPQQDGDGQKHDGDGKEQDGKEQHSDDQDGAEADGEEKKKAPMSPARKRLLIAGAVIAVAALSIAATLWWLHARRFETTDDAFIDANQSQVGAQVSGRVDAILVADNQHVDAGQAILTLDPRDYQAKLDQARAAAGNARADAQQARADLALQQANIAQQQAQVKVAQAELEQAQRDLARFRGIDPAAITRQQVDQQGATVKSDEAKVEAARQAVSGARAQAQAQQAKIAAADAQTQQAEAEIEAATLNLSYTRVVAPTAGRITRRTVNLGNFVQPGQALLAVVPDEMWVTANFKETQLTRMQVGQPVEIVVDAWSKEPIKGHVDSIQRGTGAVFSSIPAENATGNYVKVVQRVPVKIVFDGDDWKKLPLAPGMSVSPRVTVR